MKGGDQAEMWLHIGYPKTGTTFLQQDFFPAIPGLRYIPKPLIRPIVLDMVRQPDGVFDANECRRRMQTHLDKGNNLISYEIFTGEALYAGGLDVGKIAARVKAVLGHCRILITIRNQYDLAESLYRQHLHAGGTLSMREYLCFDGRAFQGRSEPDVQRLDLSYLDFEKAFSAYAAQFGAQNVTVLPFEQFQREPGTFFMSLIKWLEAQEVPDVPNRMMNEGYGVWQMRIARVLNRFLKSTLNPGAPFPDWKWPLVGRIDVGKLRMILQSSAVRRILRARSAPDEVVREAVSGFFSESNKRMNSLCGQPINAAFRTDYFGKSESVDFSSATKEVS